MDALSDAVAKLKQVQSAESAQTTQTTQEPASPWTPDMVQYLAVSVLIFTFSALLLASLLMWRHNLSGSYILKIFGVLSIIGISAVLLVVGYSNSQLTPIVGLFGAIAGYLLGKDSTPPPAPSQAKTPT